MTGQAKQKIEHRLCVVYLIQILLSTSVKKTHKFRAQLKIMLQAGLPHTAVKIFCIGKMSENTNEGLILQFEE